MRLAEPLWLFGLALVPLLWVWGARRPRLAWPTLSGFAGAPRGRAGWLRFVPAALRGMAVACLVVALARPQTVAGTTRIAGRGVAIVVALDRSSSMRAEDFPAAGRDLSRLEAARRTFEGFVRGRPDDLIGLVAFANYPDLTCPPTLAHDFLIASARELKPAGPGEDGTNLGYAIVEASKALTDASPRKRVLVLLTDGNDEPAVPRPIAPEAAADLAHDLGITLHTIAVGRAGEANRAQLPGIELPRPGKPVVGPDVERLARLAEIGGGRPFAATDTQALAGVFATIDALEKSPVRGEIRTRYREWYPPWVGAALALLALDRWLVAGRLRRLP